MLGCFGRCLDLIYPPTCMICGTMLVAGEEHVCSACRLALPRISLSSFEQNRICERMAGRLPFERAAAGFHYEKESYIQILFEAFKYGGQRQLAAYLGHLAGRKLAEQGFFKGMDVIVPVPLHRKKMRQRGYNQSDYIARGLSEESGLPVETAVLKRMRFNSTQTRKNKWERLENVAELFSVCHPERIRGKHLLLVDDVMTSGATLESCGKVLMEAGETSLSFFALALA